MTKIRVVVLLCAATLTTTHPCAAQESTPDSVRRAQSADSARGIGLKDPRIALLLGVDPGVGHFYAGERGRGYLVYAGTVVPIVVGVMYEVGAGLEGVGCMFYSPECDYARYDADLRRAHRRRNVLVAVGGAVWAYGAWDAPRAARRTNERRVNGRPPHLSLAPSAGTTPSGALYAGGRIAFR